MTNCNIKCEMPSCKSDREYRLIRTESVQSTSPKLSEGGVLTVMVRLVIYQGKAWNAGCAIGYKMSLSRKLCYRKLMGIFSSGSTRIEEQFLQWRKNKTIAGVNIFPGSRGAWN